MTVLKREEGQRVQVLSDTVCIKLRSEHSPNRMVVVTVDVPPNGFVPPHTHAQEEESYYMLEGSMIMYVDDAEFTVEPGDFVHVPVGIPHGYRNKSGQSIKFLAWTIGGAIDDFFIETSEHIKNLPDDLPRLPVILEKYGIQIVESAKV
ncbi:MAG: cupin domain-containing protein [Cyanobacteria bacterium]|nr:cupin domain-containing protein [Cyanobacteriota bacterium]MDW8199606.1 cupin domain-containing protein [Cyanobacteriota bacterium SKYGB_h_bin112]